MIQHHTLPFKSTHIHFTDQGKGPAVVFLHGFLEDARMWTKVKRYLPKRFRLICIDLFGHGTSGGVGYIYPMEEMAEALEAVIKALRLRAVHMVGHSMGGYVALAFAERNPDQLRSLALVHSTARADWPEKQRDRDRAVTLVKHDCKGFIRHAIPMLFSEQARQQLHPAIDALTTYAMDMLPGAVAASLEGMKIREDREVILHFAPYPILMLAGINDTVMSTDDVAEQMQADNVIGVWLTTAHMGPWEMPKATAEVLNAFWTNKREIMKSMSVR